MTGVEFLDSAGIGALVTLLQDLEHVRGRIALTHCQPNVAFLFKVTRLDAAIPLFDETAEAIEEFL
jgi:anti-anti-sigma factor